MTKKLPPIHPGEVLLEDFLKPYRLTPYRLAKMIGVPPIRISEIIRGKRAVTAETALLFAKCFGTSPQVWIRLQAQYDLEVTEPQIQERLAHVAVLKAA
jgi:addiction module HigA family antidote